MMKAGLLVVGWTGTEAAGGHLAREYLCWQGLGLDPPRALGEGSPFFLGGTEAAGSEAEGQAEAKRPAASVCDMWQAVTWFETPRLDSSRLAEGGSNGVTRRARALRDTSRWNG